MTDTHEVLAQKLLKVATAKHTNKGFSADFTSEKWTREAPQVQFTFGTPKDWFLLEGVDGTCPGITSMLLFSWQK